MDMDMDTGMDLRVGEDAKWMLIATWASEDPRRDRLGQALHVQVDKPRAPRRIAGASLRARPKVLDDT